MGGLKGRPLWPVMGNSRYSRAENVKLRRTLTLKRKTMQGIDRSNQAERLLYSFIDCLRNPDLFLAAESNKEASPGWRSLELPNTVGSSRLILVSLESGSFNRVLCIIPDYNSGQRQPPPEAPASHQSTLLVGQPCWRRQKHEAIFSEMDLILPNDF